MPNQTLNVILELSGNIVCTNRLREHVDHFRRNLAPLLAFHRIQVVGYLLYVPDSLLVKS